MADCNSPVFDKVFIAIADSTIKKKWVEAFKISRVVPIEYSYGGAKTTVSTYFGFRINAARLETSSIGIHADLDAVVVLEDGSQRCR
jgi:hypothetical protein